MRKSKKISLRNLPGPILSLLKEIGREADRRGVGAYLVGGFVRDLILKKNNLDVDLVVETDAVGLARWLSGRGDARLKTYPQFQTATLVYPGGLRVDIATARKETYPHPGALPVVQPGTIRDDLFRRDFTINAMAVRINVSRWEELVDEFAGFPDLKMRRIRILHDQSFMDDPTRILRAIRFEQRFDFQLEPKTRRLLKEALQNNAVNTVKPPRYFEEFKKILKEQQHLARYIKRLNAVGGLDFLGLDHPVSRSVMPLISDVEGEIKWFEARFPEKGPVERWLVYFIALISRCPLAKVIKIIKKFHLRREERDKIHAFYTGLAKIKTVSQDKLSPRQVYRLCQPLGYEALMGLWALGKHSGIRTMIAKFLVCYDSIRLSVSGDDLKRIGIPQGEKMGYILKELLSQKLEGALPTQSDELRQAAILHAQFNSR